jgi:hypothetical protein
MARIATSSFSRPRIASSKLFLSLPSHPELAKKLAVFFLTD